MGFLAQFPAHPAIAGEASGNLQPAGGRETLRAAELSEGFAALSHHENVGHCLRRFQLQTELLLEG
jgi:hypothetical protein